MITKNQNWLKNWKLNLLALCFIAIFAGLGFWQLSRAQEKRALLASFQKRTEHAPYTASALKTPNDWRFYQVKLTGKFDNKRTLLLDNKIYNGKIGYEVYTPFRADGLDEWMLVDRGFIPLGVNRNSLPAVPKAASGSVTVSGMLTLPPRYVAIGQMVDTPKQEYPIRIEFINLNEIGNLLNNKLYPYVLALNPESPSALQVKWQVFTMGPNKHMGYAVQWFAIAITLLIISVFLNRAPKKRKRARSKS